MRKRAKSAPALVSMLILAVFVLSGWVAGAARAEEILVEYSKVIRLPWGQSANEAEDPVETQSREGGQEDAAGETSPEDEETTLTEIILVFEDAEIFTDEPEIAAEEIEITVAEADVKEEIRDESGSAENGAVPEEENAETAGDVREDVEETVSEDAAGEETDPEAEEGKGTNPETMEEETADLETAEGEAENPETTEGEERDPEAAEEEATDPETGEGEETDSETTEGEATDSLITEIDPDGTLDPAPAAEEETEEEAPKKDRKAVMYSSAHDCIAAGETIQLTVALINFEDCGEVKVVWEVNRGDGWEEAGIGETFAYTATAESLGWDIQARVQYREEKEEQPDA